MLPEPVQVVAQYCAASHWPLELQVLRYTTPYADQPNQQPLPPGRQLPCCVELMLPPQPEYPGVHAAPHLPPVIEPLTQAVPVELHVCGVAPEHCVAYGGQITPHCPTVTDPVCKKPVDEQLSGRFPLHEGLGVRPGVHCAPHMPTITEPLRYPVPVVLQVRGVVPLHDAVPGVQTALQTLAVIAPFCHLPFTSQDCCTVPRHCLVPGMQTTPQLPMVSAPGVANAPLASQACSNEPLQWVCAGAHTPEQTAGLPVTQVWLVHAVGDPHMPSAPQVCTPFAEH